MLIEKTQIKFAQSQQTGELIGFVSRHNKTKKLKGVRETSTFGKQICVLSEDLKGAVIPNVLYNVELKAMHNKNGYVVVSAIRTLFKARVETIIVTHRTYQVNVTFGNKTVYFDPHAGKSPSSRTIAGALAVLASRNDIEDREAVIENFKRQAAVLIQRMQKDGYHGNTEIG